VPSLAKGYAAMASLDRFEERAAAIEAERQNAKDAAAQAAAARKPLADYRTACDKLDALPSNRHEVTDDVLIEWLHLLCRVAPLAEEAGAGRLAYLRQSAEEALASDDVTTQHAGDIFLLAIQSEKLVELRRALRVARDGDFLSSVQMRLAGIIGPTLYEVLKRPEAAPPSVEPLLVTLKEFAKVVGKGLQTIKNLRDYPCGIVPKKGPNPGLHDFTAMAAWFICKRPAEAGNVPSLADARKLVEESRAVSKK